MRKYLFFVVLLGAAMASSMASAQECVTFQRVDAALSDWSGEYLIGFQYGLNNIKIDVLNGCASRDTLNLSKRNSTNTLSYDIEGSSLTVQSPIPSVIIEKYNGAYSIKTKSGFYIGSDGSAGILAEQNKIENSISYSKNILKIQSNEYFLNGEDDKFRYSRNTTNDLSLYRATTYTRSGLEAGKMGTICLSSDASVSGAKIYSILGKLTDNNGNLDGLALMPETEIRAGVPYIFIAEGESFTASYSGSAVSDPRSAMGLVGNLGSADVVVPADCYILSGNQLRQVTSEAAEANNVKISTHRAYINLQGVSVYDGQSSAKVVLWGADGSLADDPAAIEDVAAGVDDAECVYDMNGKQMPEGSLVPGVYVRGKMTGKGFEGRKYIVK